MIIHGHDKNDCSNDMEKVIENLKAYENEKNEDGELSELSDKETTKIHTFGKALEKVKLSKPAKEITQSIGDQGKFCSKTNNCDEVVKQEVVIKDLPGKTIEQDPQHMCHVCSFHCVNAEVLEIHLKIHSEVKPHQCTLCPFASYRKDIFDSHLLLHGRKNCYVCDICYYRCTRRFLFTNHVKTHSTERPHRCSFCHFTAATKYTMINHVKKHTGRERPHQCPACKHKSATKYALLVHIKTHNTFTERPFECPHCPYRANQKVNLEKHINTKHTAKERWFKCHQCTYKSVQKVNLEKHVITKHAVGKGVKSKVPVKTRFRCHVCSLTCYSIPDLVNHLRIHIEGTASDPAPLSPNLTPLLNIELV